MLLVGLPICLLCVAAFLRSCFSGPASCLLGRGCCSSSSGMFLVGLLDFLCAACFQVLSLVCLFGQLFLSTVCWQVEPLICLLCVAALCVFAICFCFGLVTNPLDCLLIVFLNDFLGRASNLLVVCGCRFVALTVFFSGPSAGRLGRPAAFREVRSCL